MENKQTPFQTNLDRFAPVMFSASLVFLVILAALIVVFVDMPRVESFAESTPDGMPELINDTTYNIGRGLLVTLAVLWPLFVAEYCYLVMHRPEDIPSKQLRPAFFCCLCPPMRLALASPFKEGKVWLPRHGWEEPDKALRKYLERVFSKPMLVIALLILPILIVEFGLHQYVEENDWLRITLHVGTGLIWCAFAIEFITMVSVADKKLAYVKKHWIDLAIILLPLISFLRSLRVIRAAKVAKFAKVQQLTRMTRIYRMRGLLTKTVRALMLFEIFHRVLRITPEKRLEKLRAAYEEKQEELDELMSEINELEDRLKAERTTTDPETA